MSEQSLYDVRVEELPSELRSKITVVTDTDELNRRIATEFADALENKRKTESLLTVITPVGPLDYAFFADELRRRGLSCRNLRTINMDEYLDDSGKLIPTSHPLSFRAFMEKTFFSKLHEEERPHPENIVFPDPANPGEVTQLVDEADGADICWSGFGITGHMAFNDPPEMLGEPEDLESFKNCKTRCITISPMSTAQMLMGGTNANNAILPRRAVTIGMYEILKSKKIHLTFMRNWHAGLWRRALLGPVDPSFPGSLVQLHRNVEITMTELAAKPPIINTAQATGEKEALR